MEEIEDLGDPAIGHCLVYEFLRLDRREAEVEGSPEHHLEFALGLARDKRRQDRHHPSPIVEPAMGKHLVEGEIVEQLD